MARDVLKQIWPDWEIEEKPLGKGSFGVVYKAVHSDFGVNSYAAIKVISIPSDQSEIDSLRSEGLDIEASKTLLRSIVDDFVNEIRMMETLKGVPNIVSVEDYKVVEKTDEIGWDIYIRMELLKSFNIYICDKKLTEKEVIKLGIDICTALEICEQRNIIHRDIKPENIFVNDYGYFKLGDFGIARKLENMTGSLSQKGTFNYMAPEVATENKYDSRVDTYSLGIVLYRLLNGNRLPFVDTEKQLLSPNERKNAVDRRLRGEALPAPCDASPAMADIILRACAFNPDARFVSAVEMKQALTSAANGTYQAPARDVNSTISMLTPLADGNQQTVISNDHAKEKATQVGLVVNTFGPEPDVTENKRKKLKILALVTAASVACAAAVFAFLLLPKALNRSTPNAVIGGTSSSLEESQFSVAKSTESSSLSGSVLSSTTSTSSSSVSSSSSTTTAESSLGESSSSSTTTTTTTSSSSSIPVSSSTTTTTSSTTPVTLPTRAETIVTILGVEYDIATTTSLGLFDRNITDSQLKKLVPQIEKLTNLEELQLDSNEISDLTPLAKLTDLKSLRLFGNQISDISPLASLTQLTELDLRSNQIEDITPLSKLTNLKELLLGVNPLSSITPLSKLTNLKELNLQHVQISDVTPLSNLTKLQRLVLQSNEISDITPLANLKNLKTLYLDFNQISDLSPLANLTNLTYLVLTSNPCYDLKPLYNLTDLEYLNVGKIGGIRINDDNSFVKKEVDALRERIPNCEIDFW